MLWGVAGITRCPGLGRSLLLVDFALPTRQLDENKRETFSEALPLAVSYFFSFFISELLVVHEEAVL